MSRTAKKLQLLTSQKGFQSKVQAEKLKVKLQLNELFLQDISKWQPDDHADIKILILDLNIYIHHKAIIKEFLPNLWEKVAKDQTIVESALVDDINDETKTLFLAMYDRKEKQVHLDSTFTDFSCLYEGDFQKDDSLTDVVIQVEDKQFYCHKFVLCMRSEYFSLMLNGDWLETTQKVIKLNDISKSTFQTMLKFLYTNQLIEGTGASDLYELMSLAEMHNNQALKYNIKSFMRVNLCFLFQQPQPEVIKGILETLNLCQLHNYDDISDECYAWFVKYYGKIFTDRQFAYAADNIRNSIIQKIKDSVNFKTVLQNLKDLSKIKNSLPSVKWAQKVDNIIVELEDHCLQYSANNFYAVTSQASFTICLLESKDVTWTLILFDYFYVCVQKFASISNCIDICECINNQSNLTNEYLRQGKIPKEAFLRSKDFLTELKKICKDFIRKNLMKLQRSTKWKKLNNSLKEELMKNAGFVSLNP